MGSRPMYNARPLWRVAGFPNIEEATSKNRLLKIFQYQGIDILNQPQGPFIAYIGAV